MALDIKYKCDICKKIYEVTDIHIAYTKEIHKSFIEKANGFCNGNVHICKACIQIIKDTI